MCSLPTSPPLLNSVQGRLFGPAPFPVRLLLDLDGTLLQNAAGPVLSRYFGKAMPPGHPPAWFSTGLLKRLRISTGQFWQAFAENEEEIYGGSVLMPGAAACLQQLKQGGAFIAVVTARRLSAEKTTRRWLAAHNVPFDVLEMGHDNKLPIALSLNLNWAIEDDAAIAATLAQELHVLLMQPEIVVQTASGRLRRQQSGITYIASWAQVARLLPSC